MIFTTDGNPQYREPGKLLILATGVAFASLLSACGVNQVVPAGVAANEGKGASYYLPRTVVVASVPIIKSTTEPAIYPAYSLPLLLIEAEVIKKETTFTVGDEVSFELGGERDPGARFIALYPSGPLTSFTQTLNFNDQGILTKGDSSVENKTVEFAVSTLEAAAKIASSVIKPAGGTQKLFPKRSGLEELRTHINALDAQPSHQLTLDGLRAGLNVLLAGDSESYLEGLKNNQNMKAAAQNWEDFSENCPKGFTEMLAATKTAKEVTNLNEALQSGQGDRTSLKVDRDVALAKFVGRKTDKTWVGQFRWVPPSRSPHQVRGAVDYVERLFTVTTHGGVSFNVQPIIPPTSSLTGTSDHTDSVQSVSLASSAEVPGQTLTWDNLLQNSKKHGWHYRIPAAATITLRVNGKNRFTKRTFLAQQGCVAFMPATSSGQKIVSTIELDPVTGALKSAVHGGQSFDPALVGRVGAAAAGVVDAEKLKEKADATANDPVTQLTRKKTLLQLKKDISALESEGD